MPTVSRNRAICRTASRRIARKAAKFLPKLPDNSFDAFWKASRFRTGPRWTKSNIFTGRSIPRLHIVGGGSQSTLLNQFAANATRREAIAGPVEATAAGNVLIQAAALGEIESPQALRKIVSDSFSLRTFVPQDTETWQEAYDRFARLKLDVPR